MQGVRQSLAPPEEEEEGVPRHYDPATGRWLDPEMLHLRHSAAAADVERFGALEAIAPDK